MSLKDNNTCAICYDEVDQSFYECTCEITLCTSCFLSWAQTQINAQILAETVNWKCPNKSEIGKCKSNYSIEDLVDMLSMNLGSIKDSQNEEDQETKKMILELMNKLNDAALNHYLVQTIDIRKCPNSSCSYSGIVVFQNDKNNFINCCDEFVCEMCDTKWRDPLQKKRKVNIYRCVYNEVTEWLETRCTQTRQLWFTEPCPQCGMLIQKNGGCFHMRCSKCQFEFCWSCLRSFTSYRHKTQDQPVCPTRFISFYATQFLVVLLPILAKLIIQFYSMDAYRSVLYYISTFFYVKFIGTLTIILYEENIYSITKPLGFVCTMILSGFMFEFTQAALMILLIELSLVLYCFMIYGIGCFICFAVEFLQGLSFVIITKFSQWLKEFKGVNPQIRRQPQTVHKNRRIRTLNDGY